MDNPLRGILLIEQFESQFPNYQKTVSDNAITYTVHKKKFFSGTKLIASLKVMRLEAFYPPVEHDKFDDNFLEFSWSEGGRVLEKRVNNFGYLKSEYYAANEEAQELAQELDMHSAIILLGNSAKRIQIVDELVQITRW